MFLIGNSIEEDFDETGVDIVEALNLVNTVTDDDASKDFNEKEISISNIEYKADKTKTDVVENTKVSINGNTIGKVADIKKTFSFDSKFKKQIRQKKPRVKNIKPVFQEAIRRGRRKAFLQFENTLLSGLPILPKNNKIVEYNTDKEIFEEYKVNGTSLSSFSNYLTHDNEGKMNATFSVKSYELLERQWKPSKIKCDINQSEMMITTRPKKLFKFNICQIDFVKVK